VTSANLILGIPPKDIMNRGKVQLRAEGRAVGSWTAKLETNVASRIPRNADTMGSWLDIPR